MHHGFNWPVKKYIPNTHDWSKAHDLQNTELILAVRNKSAQITVHWMRSVTSKYNSKYQCVESWVPKEERWAELKINLYKVYTSEMYFKLPEKRRDEKKY